MKAHDPTRKSHTRHEHLDLREAWERNARSFIEWARKPGHDSYWRFHRDQFLRILPEPGQLTLDIGCGEGRLARDLATLNHRVLAVDASPTMAAHAREANPGGAVVIADAARLPLPDGCSDLAVAFMSLQDMDDLSGALREAARVLVVEGRLCLAIVHPINSAGQFDGIEDDSRFTIAGSYLDAFYYEDRMERDGVETTFASTHRSLETYMDSLAAAGFLVELLREPAVPAGAGVRPEDRRWQRIPLFLHLRAVRM
ncbi:MAG: class I SAM-dependent methyltransferase [Actinomycetota bacterium]